MLIGHASDEIALTGEISFKTDKRLPLFVSGATTIGELLSHPVTAPAVGQMMQKMQGMMGSMQGDDMEKAVDALGTGAEMMEAMMKGIPLKSLVSFAGAEVAAQIEQMMQSLNQALGNI